MANNGNLTCTQLQEIEINLQQRWADSAYSAEKGVVKAGAIESLMREQTASFEDVGDRTGKTRTAKVSWLEDCPITTKDMDVDCDNPVDGIEFGDNCFDVDITQSIQAQTVKIDEEKLSTSSMEFDEVVGAALYRIDQAIAEKLNTNYITMLDALPQVNLNLDTMGGLVVPSAAVGDCTTMQSPIWVDPLNYFTLTSSLNNYSNPYLLGGALFSKWALSQARAVNPQFTGEGLVELDGWRNYFDLRSFDQTIGEQKLFMLNRGDFAYVNGFYYPEIGNMREVKDGKFVYRIQSPILSSYLGRPVYHDVVYTTTCTETNGVLRKIHTWEVVNRYEIVQSPADCAGHNRVLCFTCV